MVYRLGLSVELIQPLMRCRGFIRPAGLPAVLRSSVIGMGRISPVNLRTLASSSLRAASLTSSDDLDSPLTPFQSKIAALESEALDNPSSPQAQLDLLKALAEGQEYAGLAKYYETVALEENDDARKKILLESEDAWNLYLQSLGATRRLSDIARSVRKRDEAMRNHGISSGSTKSNSASAWTTPIDTTTATESSSKTTSASPLVSSLSTPATSHSASADTTASTSSLLTSAAGSTSGMGTPLSPIYVQMAPPTAQMNAARLARWLFGMLIWGFIFLTILSMVMENTGLLKAGPGPAEFEPEEGKVVKFADVHGVEEAKAELEEIVEFLRNPEKFSTLGGKLPKGVLLTGPPGTGKTMLARAVAGEAGVPFLFASGSSFDEMFVGVGAKRVRELFATARKKSPAIIFIDELDAIGSKRSAKDQHYMKQTLNQLLVELDGFEQSEGVIIIAATNFPESLDKALTRPGRFDRHVVVGLPDVRGRIEILKHHMGEVQYDVEVDPSIIARGCPGMSGADLQNLVNQAAVKASREGSTTVQLKHFEWAKDRILMGAERRSHYVTEESKRATAYHEGGHALVALHTPGAMPLHKVTIMPRGPALGITFQLPEQDKDSYSRKEYRAMIDVALGGRAAEEMIFGHDDVTSGCSSDLQRATDVAARMIRSYGFSDKVGLVAHGDEESVYLSSKKKDEIEGEIKDFLDSGMKRTVKLLKDHEDELHKLAAALVEYETLNLDEVRLVLQGKKLDRPLNVGESFKSAAEKLGQGAIVEGI
ncbi:peptidase family M41-domain-containing protein [Kockovaella imperatae]|uniref:Peptidase family M41-domain-containing protein n=1 Tax=Kockovaella imperatae TaxID=4999 RepID=A0A1Y1US61_9TREE|nr:peptidase family M41-domain-containing protein [Kockovaella imperatae]ORX40819.1 peptidase family M41-domain-containing protein [Kockovaella imperatae]